MSLIIPSKTKTAAKAYSPKAIKIARTIVRQAFKDTPSPTNGPQDRSKSYTSTPQITTNNSSKTKKNQISSYQEAFDVCTQRVKDSFGEGVKSDVICKIAMQPLESDRTISGKDIKIGIHTIGNDRSNVGKSVSLSITHKGDKLIPSRKILRSAASNDKSWLLTLNNHYNNTTQNIKSASSANSNVAIIDAHRNRKFPTEQSKIKSASTRNAAASILVDRFSPLGSKVRNVIDYKKEQKRNKSLKQANVVGTDSKTNWLVCSDFLMNRRD